eukprot:7532539-Pyramimonas_sp.AAC.1
MDCLPLPGPGLGRSALFLAPSQRRLQLGPLPARAACPAAARVTRPVDEVEPTEQLALFMA